MLWSSETFYTTFERDNCALVENFDDLTLVNSVLTEDSLELVPWVLLKLLVTERKTTVLLVDVENLNLDLCANLNEL